MDDCLVLLGDIVTPEDIPQLKAEGIAEFFLRGTSAEDIVNKNQLSAILASEEIQAIIFTSTDDVFASGANIRELTQLNLESARDFSKLGQGLFQKIDPVLDCAFEIARPLIIPQKKRGAKPEFNA